MCPGRTCVSTKRVVRRRSPQLQPTNRVRCYSSEAEALSDVLVYQRHDARASAVMGLGLGLDEVEAPDVIAVEWSQPHARAVVQPQPTSWSISLWEYQPLATPDALNPVLAYPPPCRL